MRDGDVVVIGGGYAGVRLAKRLDSTARVTLVDRKEVFFHRIASLRAGVRPEWSATPFIPYDRLLRDGRMVVGKAVRIDTAATAGRPGDGERLPYDVVVIASGADYPEPARFTGVTAEETMKSFAAHQRKVAAAQHVLVVGGGPSGVELSAEIRLARPDARVTLAHAGPTLLHATGSERAGRKALDWLESHDVEVRLDSFISPATISAPTATRTARSSTPTSPSGPRAPPRTRSGCAWPDTATGSPRAATSRSTAGSGPGMARRLRGRRRQRRHRAEDHPCGARPGRPRRPQHPRVSAQFRQTPQGAPPLPAAAAHPADRALRPGRRNDPAARAGRRERRAGRPDLRAGQGEDPHDPVHEAPTRLHRHLSGLSGLSGQPPATSASTTRSTAAPPPCVRPPATACRPLRPDARRRPAAAAARRGTRMGGRRRG